MRFLIGIVGLGTNPHSRCFEDVARALAAALREGVAVFLTEIAREFRTLQKSSKSLSRPKESSTHPQTGVESRDLFP